MLNKSWHIFATFLGCALFASGAFFGCSESNEVAGGVSEETNTLAGILVDNKGKAARRVSISARYIKVDTLVFTDTTDDDGRFGLPLSRTGRYGLSAQNDSFAYYETINYEGKEIEVNAALQKVRDVSGKLHLRPDTNASYVKVYIPGSNWRTETDDEGYFTLEGVPSGTFALIAKSPDPVHYSDAMFMTQVSDKKVNLTGPFAFDYRFYEVTFAPLGLDPEIKAAEQDSKALLFPLSSEYGLRSWFSMDYMTSSGKENFISDARDWTEGMIVYGGAKLGEGVENKALVMNGAKQYGVIENDRYMLDSAREFTIEAWVEIDSVLGNEKSYRKNIIGKLGFGSDSDEDVFSLALIKGVCNVDSVTPVLAFFLANGAGDSLSCDNAVYSYTSLKFGTWMYITVTWNGDVLSLYVNGLLEQSKVINVNKIEASSESIFFGKEAINLKLDDVRFGLKAIHSSDVQFRYHLKGGAL